MYGADRSWYLVNGSTCGILAAIAAAVKPGEKILMARNSHKSAYHAVILNQLEPVYLYPEFDSNAGLNMAVSASQSRWNEHFWSIRRSGRCL